MNTTKLLGPAGAQISSIMNHAAAFLLVAMISQISGVRAHAASAGTNRPATVLLEGQPKDLTKLLSKGATNTAWEDGKGIVLDADRDAQARVEGARRAREAILRETTKLKSAGTNAVDLAEFHAATAGFAADLATNAAGFATAEARRQEGITRIRNAVAGEREKTIQEREISLQSEGEAKQTLEKADQEVAEIAGRLFTKGGELATNLPPGFELEMARVKARYIEAATTYALLANDVGEADGYATALRAWDGVLDRALLESQKNQIRAESEARTATGMSQSQTRALERLRRRREFVPESIPGLNSPADSTTSIEPLPLPSVLLLLGARSTNSPGSVVPDTQGPRLDSEDLLFFKSKAKAKATK